MAGRAVMGLVAVAAVLAACSQPAPAAKPKAPSTAGPPAPAPGVLAWRPSLAEGSPTAVYGKAGGAGLIAIRCSPAEHRLSVIFQTLGEGEFGPQTATLHAGGLSLSAPVRFRSPEDAAKDDPPGWAEFTATPELLSALFSAPAIRVERTGKGAAGPAAIDTGPANVALTRVIGACR
jgi:hypothetical protein